MKWEYVRDYADNENIQSIKFWVLYENWNDSPEENYFECDLYMDNKNQRLTVVDTLGNGKSLSFKNPKEEDYRDENCPCQSWDEVTTYDYNYLWSAVEDLALSRWYLPASNHLYEIVHEYDVEEWLTSNFDPEVLNECERRLYEEVIKPRELETEREWER